jgi:Mce-associated membrane protein
VLAIAALVLGALLLTRAPSAKEREDTVRQVAEDFSVALSSYDYRHLDRDLARVRAMGAGHFHFQYEDVLGGQAFRNALLQNQAVASAKVLKGPYVAAIDHQEARVFTVLDQRIAGKQPAQPQQRQVLVESILVKTGDGWKVDWVVLS